MRKALVWGFGQFCRQVWSNISSKCEIIGIIDNSNVKWGMQYNGVLISGPERLSKNDYDVVIITTLVGYDEIKNQVIQDGYEASILDLSYVETPTLARIQFVKKLAILFEEDGVEGCVGEAGVFRGEFARIINESFPQRECYLFDTFDGFSQSDMECEKEIIGTSVSGLQIQYNHFAATSEELVLEKMPYKDTVIIKKGVFPHTTEGLDKTFAFINLDMDLYKPTLEGLRYFMPRMAPGGIILIHDYFVDHPFTVKDAVKAYEIEYGHKLMKFPIGDIVSLGIKCGC